MFKKELADALKQTGWFLAALLVLAGAFLALRIVPRQPYASVFVPVLQGGLVFWGLFLGASAFGRERRERAMEYALSLPYSRRELLLRMAGARLTALAALWVLSLIAHLLKTNSSGADAWGFGAGTAVFSLVLFTIGLSLATVIENFIVLCLVSISLWLLTFPMTFLLGRAFAWLKGWNVSALPRYSYEGSPLILPSMHPSWLVYMSILLGILPFAAALYFSFPRFDLRPSAAFKKRYARLLAAGLAACLVGGFLAAVMTYSDSIFMRSLTPDHKLVEFGEMGVRIRSSAGVQKIRNGYPLGWPGSAAGGRIAYSDGEGLFLLDTANGRSRPLYDSREGRPRIGRAWVCGEHVLFLDGRESRGAARSLHVVDLDSSDVREYRTVRFALDASPLWKLKRPFGTGVKEGRRFWLFVADPPRTPPLRIWEDGLVQEITEGRSRFVSDAVYINDLVLLLTTDGLAIFCDAGNSFAIVKTITDGFSFNTGWWWDDLILDQPRSEVLYGMRDGRVARLDLKSLEITDISAVKTAARAQVFAFLPDRFYLLERIPADKSMIVSAIHDDQIERLKEFTGLLMDRPGSRLEVQREGILFHSGKRITVYAFPDLREIHY